MHMTGVNSHSAQLHSVPTKRSDHWPMLLLHNLLVACLLLLLLYLKVIPKPRCGQTRSSGQHWELIMSIST